MTAGALVLAGGGTLGVAWETGLVAGLLDEGVDLRGAAVVVGTSAGSVVGSRLATGADPRPVADLLAQPPAAASADPGPDSGEELDALAAGFARMLETYAGGGGASLSVVDIGHAALTASSIPEETYLSWFSVTLEIDGDWPDALIVTTIDTATGELIALDRSTGAPLPEAVAASCSVPGLLPPVTIDGRRLMDGGVRSVTNAELVLGRGARDVVVVATLTGRSPEGTLVATWERRMRREVEALEGAGHSVTVLLADDDDIAAMGANPMDHGRTHLAAVAGRRRGRREASRRIFDGWRTPDG